MDSPHTLHGTVKAVYSLSYSMPGRKGVNLHELQSWTQRGAVWQGSQYTSWIQPEERILHVYSSMWNSDNSALRRSHTCYASMMHGPLVCSVSECALLYINGPSAFRGSPEYTQ